MLNDSVDAILAPGNPNTYPAAKRLLEQVIASGSPRARACAAAKLAELLDKEKAEADSDAKTAAASSSWEQELQTSWTAWNKKHFDPLKDIVISAAGLIVLLLVLARLLTGTLVSPDHEAPKEWVRRAWWSTGLALITLCGICVPVSLRVDPKASSRWPVFLGVVTVLLVAALITPRGDRRWRRPEVAVVAAGAVAAVLSTPASDFALVAPGPDLPDGILADVFGDVDLVLLLGVWAGVVGVVLMATARGLALAIEVQVRGSSGSDNSSHARMLVARLQELGSENPRDIRALGPSDVTSLPEDALTAVPNGAWAMALFNILKVLRPAAPWRVTVTQPDNSTMVMDITRNRLAVERTSLVLNVADIPSAPASKKVDALADATKKDTASDGTLDELLTVAAAQTLLVLSGPHRELGVGLCGATDWRALAFHAISGRTGVAPERRSELLHAAIDASPRYLLPRMAVVNAMDDKDPDDRVRYADAIDQLWDDFKEHLEPVSTSEADDADEVDQVHEVDDIAPYRKQRSVEDGYEAVQLRLLYNQAVAWMNVRADRKRTKDPAEDTDEKIEKAWASSATAALRLDARLEALRKHRVLAVEPLRLDSRLPATFLLLDLDTHSLDGGASELRGKVKERADKLAPEKKLPEPQTRNDYYARACYRASIPMAADESAEAWRLALLDLKVAATASRFAEWAPYDPSMAIFTDSKGGDRAGAALITKFKELVARPPADSYLDMPAFKPHAAALKAYGLTDLDALLIVPPDDLASAAKVHASVARQWIEVAKLHHHLAALGNHDTVLMPLLELMLALEIQSPADFRGRLAGDMQARAAFYQEMVTRAAAMRILPTWEETIGLWARDPKPPDVE